MSDKDINLNQQVVALHYDGESAPTVTAKGRGYIADEILNIANQHDIPIKQDADLVQFLSQVELGSEIPETLYLAVAEVIAFAYLIKGKNPSKTL